MYFPIGFHFKLSMAKNLFLSIQEKKSCSVLASLCRKLGFPAHIL
jgi:hypothetical protein